MNAFLVNPPNHSTSSNPASNNPASNHAALGYTSDEVQQILTIALTKDVSSAMQLKEMAEELSIDEATLLYAIDVWQGQKARAKEAQWRRQRFYRQELLPYVAVNAFLLILDISLSGRITWSIYPLLGWGAGLALGLVTGLSPSLWGCKGQVRQPLATVFEQHQ